MADIDFPSTLPLPINREISYNETQNTFQLNLAKGAPVNVVWSTDSSVRYNVTWNYSEQQLRALRGFYDLILDKGTKWFDMEVQWMGNSVHHGENLTRIQECNFYGSEFAVTNNGKRRIITATLLIRNIARD